MSGCVSRPSGMHPRARLTIAVASAGALFGLFLLYVTGFFVGNLLAWIVAPVFGVGAVFVSMFAGARVIDMDPMLDRQTRANINTARAIWVFVMATAFVLGVMRGSGFFFGVMFGFLGAGLLTIRFFLGTALRVRREHAV